MRRADAWGVELLEGSGLAVISGLPSSVKELESESDIVLRLPDLVLE